MKHNILPDILSHLNRFEWVEYRRVFQPSQVKVIKSDWWVCLTWWDISHPLKSSSFLVSDDHAIEAGNIASSSSRSQPLTENINHGVGDIRPEQKDKLQKNREQWLMNYQEASIYLEEGRNNEKFDTHPRSQSALPAYLIGMFLAPGFWIVVPTCPVPTTSIA